MKLIKKKISLMKVYATFSVAFLMAFLAAGIFAPVETSDAAQIFSVDNTNTGYYVNIDASAVLSLDVNATPDGALRSTKDTVTTTTNSPRGYKLYISASPNYLYLNGDSSTAGQGKFSPLGASLTVPTKLAKNTWGVCR